MALFTDDELADLAAEQAAALPDACVVARPSGVPDGAGGQTSASTTVGTLPCRYEPESRRAVVVVVAGRVVAVAYWTFTFAAGADVRPGDALTVGGRTWRVAGAQSPTSYQLATRVRALEQE